MSRDKITPVELTADAGTDVKNATVATAINTTNGGYIDLNGVSAEKLLIHAKNTEGSTNTVTINSGIYSRSSLGNLVVTVAATSGEQGIVIETARFKDADGYITLDYESGMTGTVAAYLLP
jgi:hypothetical protein